MRRIAQIVSLGLALAAATGPAFATTTYTYDALGRVTSVTYDDGSIVYYYYDAAGNRTTVIADAN